MNERIDLPYKLRTLDKYFMRKSILAEIKLQAQHFSGVFLDVGCGYMPYRSTIVEIGRVNKYLGMDLDTDKFPGGMKPDVTWDGIKIPLDNNSVDTAMATEVLEHCPEPGDVLKEIARVLKPDGYFVVTVPFLWPLHAVPYDEYRYTPFSLNRLFDEAGFKNINIKALGGWNASLAQMIGLWVRRAPMPRVIRYGMSLLAYPLIYLLIWSDRNTDSFERKGGMFTSLSVSAYKC